MKRSRSGALVALLTFALLACSEQARERREVHEQAAPPLLLQDLPSSATTAAEPRVRRVYVPVYSRIFVDLDRVLELAVTLSIRNTDDQSPIALTSIRYYASSGELIEEYLTEGPVELAPMSTGTQPMARVDRRGGEGANFIVEWTAAAPVSDPIVEAVMVSGGTQGVAFVSRGREIRRREPEGG